MDAERNTPEGDELEVLALVIDAYEDTHYPIDAPVRIPVKIAPYSV